MNDFDNFDAIKEHAEELQAAAARLRAVGSPLSTGVSQRALRPAEEGKAIRFTAPPPSRALPEAPAEPARSSGVQRTVNILRAALPLVQRLLPLLDGNVGTALSNVISPRPQPPAAGSSGRPDLAPIEDGLARLRSQQNSLRLQVTEQNTSLKRVEDQLEMVRESADRNTLEQQELLEDLRAFGKNVKIIAILALVLAAAGFFMTLALLLRMYKVLP
jgi:hypothetical protein